MAGGAKTHISQRRPPSRGNAAQFQIFCPRCPWQKEPFRPKWRKGMSRDSTMKTMSAREAKNGFGLMIDTARAAPVLIEKHGRGVVVVVSVEEYERLSLAANVARGSKRAGEASKSGE
jgi:prevent-host-death family protein